GKALRRLESKSFVARRIFAVQSKHDSEATPIASEIERTARLALKPRKPVQVARAVAGGARFEDGLRPCRRGFFPEVVHKERLVRGGVPTRHEAGYSLSSIDERRGRNALARYEAARLLENGDTVLEEPVEVHVLVIAVGERYQADPV